MKSVKTAVQSCWNHYKHDSDSTVIKPCYSLIHYPKIHFHSSAFFFSMCTLPQFTSANKSLSMFHINTKPHDWSVFPHSFPPHFLQVSCAAAVACLLTGMRPAPRPSRPVTLPLPAPWMAMLTIPAWPTWEARPLSSMALQPTRLMLVSVHMGRGSNLQKYFSHISFLSV